ncbi:MAG: helix-turn-helix transcriptional regulator [Bdellovibrionaceae bacterium]|nr:helix-turn-helix transcriptional regulator [Pseudobdellovibrionaceae bacterium]
MELRIAQLRKKKDITQKQLAELCSTTQQQIAKIENGNVDPQLSTLRRLADSLNCEVKDLFYSKIEFLEEIQLIAKKSKLNLMQTSIIELNSVCSKEMGVPSLHPYWSSIQIKNNKVFFKEDK